MLDKVKPRPVVFLGPSGRLLSTEARRAIDVRPPAKRGDLEALRNTKGPGVVLLVDGLFGSSLAVTPTECRHLLEDGWSVCGASSMGALRASELWSVGMIGIGEIYLQFRLDPIPSDGDVAVAYHPDTNEELTVSVVELRAIVGGLERRGCRTGLAACLLESGSRIFWGERTWGRLAQAWRQFGTDGADALTFARAWAATPEHHPKVRDATLAVASLTRTLGEIGYPSTCVEELLAKLNRVPERSSWLARSPVA